MFRQLQPFVPVFLLLPIVQVTPLGGEDDVPPLQRHKITDTQSSVDTEDESSTDVILRIWGCCQLLEFFFGQIVNVVLGINAWLVDLGEWIGFMIQVFSLGNLYGST